jgi:hypothetical protein
MIEHIYRLTCDWPNYPCRKVWIIEAETLVDVQRRARAEGWSFAEHTGRRDGKPSLASRCPTHAYTKAVKPTGRPRKKIA